MGLLRVARANTAVGVSPDTFLLLLYYYRLASVALCAAIHKKYKQVVTTFAQMML
jgi:hypothetical protein